MLRICEICDKGFETPQRFGGHVSLCRRRLFERVEREAAEIRRAQKQAPIEAIRKPNILDIPIEENAPPPERRKRMEKDYWELPQDTLTRTELLQARGYEL